MATISTPIHSGYTIINGSISGGSSSKIGTWMEYKVVSQSITNNTSTIRFYVFLATLSGSYNVYANNHSGTNRGAMSVAVGGSTVYTRDKERFCNRYGGICQQLYDSVQHGIQQRVRKTVPDSIDR